MTEHAWVPTLEDYIDVASVVLAASSQAIRGLPRLPLAESAIHAPFASWKPEDVEVDATMVERVATGGASHDEVVQWLTARTCA